MPYNTMKSDRTSSDNRAILGTETTILEGALTLADQVYIQKCLIENYRMRRGALNELQLGNELYQKWSSITQTLFDQIISLKAIDWSGSVELKEVSIDSPFWDTIRILFNKMIGLVNGYRLEISGDAVCLLMAYATNKNQTTEKYSRFINKLEYYLARQIIIQKSKSSEILEDEKLDRKSIRLLRKHTLSKVDTSPQEKSGDEIVCDNSCILYIYKGNICCHRDKHNLLQATAILHSKADDEIKLNVEYCSDCQKFLLSYTLFEEYRTHYGVLIGNFRLTANGEFTGNFNLAQESPLMLSGYNVSQRDDYTMSERHYILARIIHDGIMDKGDVIRYLSYFIRKNGARTGNEFALCKWQEDLEFVQSYNMDTQPKTIISAIKEYRTSFLK